MGTRLELHDILVDILGSDNVYFQPPPAHQMEYPAIVYERDYAATQFADNSPYRYTKRYKITIIDRDPDSLTPDKIAMLPLTTFDRHFVTTQLNHDIFNTYF